MLVLKSLISLTLLLLQVNAYASAEPQWGAQTIAASPSRNNNSPPKQTGGRGGPKQAAPPAAPRPTPPAAKGPRDDPDDDEPKWTAPPLWGPKGSRPFGPRSSTSTTPTAGGRRTTKPPAPKVTSYNSDQIPTTTVDVPKEPVPFVATCGKKRYDEYDVSNALTAGCYYFKKGQKIPGTDYPKPFTNSQRFDFGDVKSGLFEFPLIESAPFISGDPGLDRVIFSTPDCFLAGELTMQGQAAGRYTECSEEY